MKNVLLDRTLYVMDWTLLMEPLFLMELSEGSMRWASKERRVVTLTTYSVTESVFSMGGLHDTFNCFSFRGSTSTSSGGLGRSSEKQSCVEDLRFGS